MPKIKSKSSSVLVAIVGGSGSGKSWLADKLKRLLGKHAARLSQDDFYRDRSHIPILRRARINFDSPRAIDWRELECVLGLLRAGRAARFCNYDFKTHTRSSNWTTLKCAEIILVDGLWLLRRRSLRKLFTLKIFLKCPARVRLQRRLIRDVASRGRTPESVREQFWKTVEPMHKKFVEPQAEFADIILENSVTPAQIRRLLTRICSAE